MSIAKPRCAQKKKSTSTVTAGALTPGSNSGNRPESSTEQASNPLLFAPMVLRHQGSASALTEREPDPKCPLYLNFGEVLYHSS